MWAKAHAAEHQYGVQLRAVARQVGVLVKGIAPNGSLKNVDKLYKALNDYAKLLGPWAESVASLMVADIYRRDLRMWKQNSKEMSRELRGVLVNSPVSGVLSALQDDQVKLIKSLPLKAAERVHALSLNTLLTSARASEVQREIMNTQAVTEYQARRIARTEVSRASSNLLQARAQYAGSEGYIWHTSRDSDVRESHQAMEGKYVRWGSPPTLDKMTGHAGCFPFCRCFAEPLFKD